MVTDDNKATPASYKSLTEAVQNLMLHSEQDNTDVMELTESLLMLSDRVNIETDTLPVDTPRQPDVIKDINKSLGVEVPPIPSHPVANPAEFNTLNKPSGAPSTTIP